MLFIFYLILSVATTECQMSVVDNERGVALVATNPVAGKDQKMV